MANSWNQSSYIDRAKMRNEMAAQKYALWINSWDEYEAEVLLLDAESKLVKKEKAEKEKAFNEKKKKAETAYNLSQNQLRKIQKDLEVKIKAWTASRDEMKTYKENSSKFEPFSKIDEKYWDSYIATGDALNKSEQPIASNANPRVTPPTQVPWTQLAPTSDNTPAPTVPQKNPANVYDTQSGKMYDASAIPSVLQGGKIRPERYFLQNGLNWMRDRKRIAQEAGIQNYTGTPGQNYAMVQYLEDKKGWKLPWGEGTEWGLPKRQFDGIDQSVIPNRFSEEDVAKLQAMTPEDQAKFIQQRNLEDLKKALPGNLWLINKVFGTNYTSDDLTGGIGRATVMGTGMTSKAMEINNLINGLTQATADKFMSKWAELDNAGADRTRIETWSVQSGRRKILEDMVDGRIPMGQGTSLDANDQKYMEAYKTFKVQKGVADKYNSMIQRWNTTTDATVRIKYGKQIRDYIDSVREMNPEVYESMKTELDRIPTLLQSGGKLSPVTAKNPADAQATPAPQRTTPPSSSISINRTSTGTIKENSTIPGGTPQTADQTPTPQGGEQEMRSVSGGVIKEPDQKAPNDEGRYGYSSNSISQW